MQKKEKTLGRNDDDSCRPNAVTWWREEGPRYSRYDDDVPFTHGQITVTTTTAAFFFLQVIIGYERNVMYIFSTTADRSPPPPPRRRFKSIVVGGRATSSAPAVRHPHLHRQCFSYTFHRYTGVWFFKKIIAPLSSIIITGVASDGRGGGSLPLKNTSVGQCVS